AADRARAASESRGGGRPTTARWAVAVVTARRRTAQSQLARTYVPGAFACALWARFPSAFGAGLISPERSASHASQSDHQLPGSLGAWARNSSGLSGSSSARRYVARVSAPSGAGGLTRA